MARLCILVLAALCLAFPALAEVRGIPSVTDGDTLEIAGQRIRLHGIDAPETRQLCQDAAGKDWRCGQRAALALSDKIGRSSVACTQKDKDRYGRIVAVCWLGTEDLNAWMVSQGWALAYREYSRDYVGAEASAQAARRGIWAGTFQAPWDWRRAEREGRSTIRPTTANQNQGSGDCAIKGNINSKGDRIYHVPGGRHYEQTQISKGKGERWFCSEAEAREAGWRRSRQ